MVIQDKAPAETKRGGAGSSGGGTAAGGDHIERPLEKVGARSAGGHMRQSMPRVAAWIDALREEFGHADVTNWMQDGLKAGTFYATENGHEVGKPIPAPANAITADRMVLQAAPVKAKK